MDRELAIVDQQMQYTKKFIIDHVYFDVELDSVKLRTNLHAEQLSHPQHTI